MKGWMDKRTNKTKLKNSRCFEWNWAGVSGLFSVLDPLVRLPSLLSLHDCWPTSPFSSLGATQGVLPAPHSLLQFPQQLRMGPAKAGSYELRPGPVDRWQGAKGLNHSPLPPRMWAIRELEQKQRWVWMLGSLMWGAGTTGSTSICQQIHNSCISCLDYFCSWCFIWFCILKM